MACTNFVFVLCLTIGFSTSLAEMSGGANPIRKVVTLMQNMQKEIEAEGAKEKELFDKFMCFCGGSGSELQTEIATGKAKIEELTAKVKSEEAEKVQLIQEVADHKTDREQAKADLAEATTLREKEKADFDAVAADSKANIEGLAQAIPAIEKGMSGASFLQTPNGNRVLKLVESFTNMDDMDRRNVISFLEDKDSDMASSGGAGEILGIMKQMKESMEANLAESESEEAKAVEGFADLKSSKEKEIEVATESIESKTVRSGELAVSVVEAKDALEDTTQEVADNEKFASGLTEQCAAKEKEWAQRQKDRAAEISAVSEAIGILNDDDALDVFKKAIPSASLAQEEVGLLQESSTAATPFKRAQAILATLATKKGMQHSKELGLMLYSLSSKMRLANKGKTQNFGEIIKAIDEMVTILGKEQKDDDKQKGWCQDELDKATDEETSAKEKLAQVDAQLAEMTDAVTTLGEEIAALGESIKALDKAVAQATEQRKEEHEEALAAAQMSQAAVQLVGKAKDRMNKFYNPSMIQQAPGFLQIRVHRARRDLFGISEDDEQPEAPETFSGEVKKNEKSAGVIGMMDMIIRDLENEMKDAEYEEKTAQADYAELMSDSEATRQQDSKSLTDKSASKADLEGKLVTAKSDRASAAEELSIVQTGIQDLHGSCDFLLQNYDLRKEARTNEIEGLKNAKAMLSGANFGF
jgi:uncharacterized coiled-coil DUF342 family protein